MLLHLGTFSGWQTSLPQALPWQRGHQHLVVHGGIKALCQVLKNSQKGAKKMSLLKPTWVRRCCMLGSVTWSRAGGMLSPLLCHQCHPHPVCQARGSSAPFWGG